jgi:hypothetical protein
MPIKLILDINKKAAFKRSGFLVAVGGGIEPP